MTIVQCLKSVSVSMDQFSFQIFKGVWCMMVWLSQIEKEQKNVKPMYSYRYWYQAQQTSFVYIGLLTKETSKSSLEQNRCHTFCQSKDKYSEISASLEVSGVGWGRFLVARFAFIVIWIISHKTLDHLNHFRLNKEITIEYLCKPWILPLHSNPHRCGLDPRSTSLVIINYDHPPLSHHD